MKIPPENLSKDVVKEIYGEKIDPFSGDLVGKVVLSCRNKIVNQLNERILNLLYGNFNTYNAISTVSKTDSP